MTTLFVVGSTELLLPAVVEDLSVVEEEVDDSEVPEDDCCGGLDGSVCGGFDGVDEDEEDDDEDGGVEEDGGHDVDGCDEGVLDEVEVEVGVEDEVVGQFGVEGCEGGVEDGEEDGGVDVPGLPPEPGSGLLLPGAGFCTLLPVFGSDGRASTFSLYSLAHLRTV